MNQIPPQSKSSVVPWFSFPHRPFLFPLSTNIWLYSQDPSIYVKHVFLIIVLLWLAWSFRYLWVGHLSLSLFFALVSSFSLFCCIGSVFAKHNISTVERLLGACVLSLSNTLPHTHVSGIAPLRLWTPHLSGKHIGRSNVCVYCWMGHCIATLAPCVGLRFTSDTLVCSTRKENVFLKAFCSGKDFSDLKERCYI